MDTEAVVPAPTTLVLATTPDGTRAALRAAHCRTQAHRNVVRNVVLLVPCLFRQDGGMGTDSCAALISEYRALALDACPAASVYVVVCHRPEDAFRQFLTGPMTVLIGGRRGTWWRPTTERRLARRLARQGHTVVFEDLAG